MKPYLLSLDLGTSSIGYVAFNIDDKSNPISVLDLGGRIFPDGRNPKTKEPLAVSRRLARGIRRNRDRGQNRVRRLVKELIESGLLPEDETLRREVFKICPYSARNEAANATVEPYTLGRALFHLGRRRGFKSNRLSGDSEETEFKAKIANLRELLGKNTTLGQYLFKRHSKNIELLNDKKPREQQTIRFKGGETEFYPDRAMYEHEFDAIRLIQANALLSDAQWDMIKETILFQYPLKPVPKGKCRFYPEETRAHLDLPITHQFRIYQEVNSLRYTSQGQEFPLDERQRLALYKLLDEGKTLGFKALVKKKDVNNSPYFPSDAEFNLDVASRKGKLLGNAVMCDLRKADHLGKLADTLPTNELNSLISFLIEPTEEVDGKIVLLDDDAVETWLADQLPALSSQQVKCLCNYRFKRGAAAVSLKFIYNIVPVLKSEGCVYSDAVALLKDDNGNPLHHSNFEMGEVVNELPYYGVVMPESVWGDHPESDMNKSENERDNDAYLYGKIANPTVHVALNQLRVVVNTLIKKIGNAPSRIHVELTRDLKNSKDARADIEKSQARNAKNNARIIKELNGLNIPNPSRKDIEKYKLWEELGGQGIRQRIFSGRSISASQAMGPDVEVEHIIPFSRCYDDGFNNKTLAFQSENHDKLNKTPFEAFGHDREHYAEIISRALACFGQSSKFDRFKEGSFDSFYGEGKGDLIARQLNDTKYISTKAKQYLSCLCTSHNVQPVNGQMTAMLRSVWDLNTYKNRDEGNYREDHRHHIVDAFVVGLTSPKLVRQLNTVSSHSDNNVDNLYRLLKKRAPDITEIKNQLVEKLDNVVVSYKSDHTQTGSMFNDTAYGFGVDGEGEKTCITRKSIESLSYDEVFDIRDGRLRDELISFLTCGKSIEINYAQRRVMTTELKSYFLKDSGSEDKAEFINQKKAFSERCDVEKARINIKNQSVKPITSAPYKGYAKNSYAFCEVWMIPTGIDPKTKKKTFKYEGDFVAYADVNLHKKDSGRNKPHPAAKKLMRLYKNDCIRLETDGQASEIFKVSGFSATRNQIDIAPQLSTNSVQAFKSINVVFNEQHISKVRT